MYTEPDTATTAPPAESCQPSRAAYAYAELKRRLLMGDFRLGQRLGETQLGDLLGVSRTPVRDALSRLHAEGLILRLQEGGYAPAAPDLTEIAEFYEVRRGLEVTAIARRHDRAALRAIGDEWAAMEPPTSDTECGPDFVLLDERFHCDLARASGNRALTELLSKVNERIRFVRMHDFLTADRVTKTIAEHQGIVDALLEAGDGAGAVAERRLRNHLQISEQVVEDRAVRALGRMRWGTIDG